MIRKILFAFSILFIGIIVIYYAMNLKDIASMMGKKSRTDVIRNAYNESIFNKSPIKVTLGNGSVLAIVAITSQERDKGLMYTESMVENEGMFFVFPSSKRHIFWMFIQLLKNQTFELIQIRSQK